MEAAAAAGEDLGVADVEGDGSGLSEAVPFEFPQTKTNGLCRFVNEEPGVRAFCR